MGLGLPNVGFRLVHVSVLAYCTCGRGAGEVMERLSDAAKMDEHGIPDEEGDEDQTHLSVL